MIKNILLALIISTQAYAGLPPTTTSISGNASHVATFNFEFPNFAATRSGVTTTFGILGISGGGTGNANGVLGTALTGYSIGTTIGTVSSSDTVLQAIQKISGNQKISEFDSGNSGTSKTLDFTNGYSQKSTLTGNVTFTFSNPISGQAYVLKLVQDGTGSRTVTWPAAVKWSGGTAPTLTTTASKTDLINLYYDGTNYFGSYSLNY